MIRNVRVIHREINTWVRANTFEGSLDTPFGVDQTMFEKNYPRGTSTEQVWADIREQMLVTFFGVFYPQVVDVTKQILSMFKKEGCNNQTFMNFCQSRESGL